MLTVTSLSHPTTMRKIDAAMRAAVQHSFVASQSLMQPVATARAVWGSSGRLLFTAIHSRGGRIPALYFVDPNGRDITPLVRAALRRVA